MDKLWAKRTPPNPMDWNSLGAEGEDDTTTAENANAGGIRDQDAWSLRRCRDVFSNSVKTLREKLQASNYTDHLVWDKVCM